jgi:short-subunit dehydrogenase
VTPDYRGKVVVLTGASSGIGYVTAREFARRGSIVVAVARREPRLQGLLRLCQADSPASSYLCGDLAERGFAEHVIDHTVAAHGRIDVLVNNAGISKHKQIYHMSADEADYVMRVNCMSYIWTTLAAIPPMLRAGGGTIVNISSFAAKLAPPREAVYAASKAAVNLFSEGLWADLEGSGIHVALINPGAIDTEIWDKEDEPVAFRGRKYPAELIRAAIFEAIEKRVHEMTVPRSPDLLLARAFRLLAPGLMRKWLARFDPVPREIVERARARAEKGKRLGDLTES